MIDMLDWLSTLPEPLLYGALVLAAFAENLFPPLPADTVIALGAFVAARGQGSAVAVWAATMLGNVGGAMMMYGLGHRFGVRWLQERVPSLFPSGATERITDRFKTQGLLAVALSRFLPGVRAVVPPLAGAMDIGALRALIAMSLASGVWYGLVCVLAFRAGANADVLLNAIAGQQRTAGLVAAGMLAVVASLIWWRRRQRPS